MQAAGRINNASQQAHSRKRDTYLNKLNSGLRESLKSIQENYEMMLSRAKLESQILLCRSDPYALATQEDFECNVRSANIVNACEAITRLVSEIKLLLILGDFRWLESSVKEGVEDRECRALDLSNVTLRLRESISRDLNALEDVLGRTPRRTAEHSSCDTEDKFHPLN